MRHHRVDLLQFDWKKREIWFDTKGKRVTTVRGALKSFESFSKWKLKIPEIDKWSCGEKLKFVKIIALKINRKFLWKFNEKICYVNFVVVLNWILRIDFGYFTSLKIFFLKKPRVKICETNCGFQWWLINIRHQDFLIVSLFEWWNRRIRKFWENLSLPSVMREIFRKNLLVECWNVIDFLKTDETLKKWVVLCSSTVWNFDGFCSKKIFFFIQKFSFKTKF